MLWRSFLCQDHWRTHNSSPFEHLHSSFVAAGFPPTWERLLWFNLQECHVPPVCLIIAIFTPALSEQHYTVSYYICAVCIQAAYSPQECNGSQCESLARYVREATRLQNIGFHGYTTRIRANTVDSKLPYKYYGLKYTIATDLQQQTIFIPNKSTSKHSHTL